MAFKDTFRKNIVLAVFVYWALALKGIVRHRFAKRSLKTGERTKNVGDMSKYVEFCLSRFSEGGFDGEAFSNALELGPGDSIALATAIAQRKQCSVDLIEKYQEGAVGANQVTSGGESSVQWLDLKKGQSTQSLLMGRQYDLIYSVSVLEHLWPWRQVLGEYIAALKADGVMYHIVNFTDHGLFTPYHDPFLFRRIPRIFYEPAMRPIGRPNRALPSEICAFFNNQGFQVDLRVIKTHTRVLSPGEDYTRQSIPRNEQEALNEGVSFSTAADNMILDQCLGSAVIKAWRYG